MPESRPPVHRGGCHCSAVRFEARGEIAGALICNCSICTMKGYVHWVVPRDAFTLLSGEDQLRTYRFGTRAARHHFCATCGVAPFYVARSDPDKIDVNLRCVEGVHIETLDVERFDGRNWEQAFEERRR